MKLGKDREGRRSCQSMQRGGGSVYGLCAVSIEVFDGWRGKRKKERGKRGGQQALAFRRRSRLVLRCCLWLCRLRCCSRELRRARNNDEKKNIRETMQ